MNIPEELNYTKSHEWVKYTGEKVIAVGLTDFAQHELGDLVFVNLPSVGDNVEAGSAFADVESVKAVSDIYSPVSGVISKVNEVLLDSPESINESPYEAWLVEIADTSETEELLSASEYGQYLASRKE